MAEAAALENEKGPLIPEKPPKTGILLNEKGSRFLARVESETGANLSACYQCERCTNACPVSPFMDIQPHQVVRWIQLGLKEPLLSSSTIWVCLSCEMCSTYCPNEVAPSLAIGYLRNAAFRSVIQPKEEPLAIFHRIFLQQLKRFGRINEFWLLAAFNSRPQVLKEKWKDGSLKEELQLACSLWWKGRWHLFPSRSRAIHEIRKGDRKRRRGIRP